MVQMPARGGSTGKVKASLELGVYLPSQGLAPPESKTQQASGAWPRALLTKGILGGSCALVVPG